MTGAVSAGEGRWGRQADLDCVASSVRTRTEPQITAAIGLSRPTVQGWVQRDNENGLDGLRDRTGRGRNPILTPEEQQAVGQRVEHGPQEGDVCSLRGVDYQKFIEDQFGKRMSRSAVYDLLHGLNEESLMPRSKHRKSDSEAVAAFPKKFPKSWCGFRPSIPTIESSSSFKMSAASANKGR